MIWCISLGMLCEYGNTNLVLLWAGTPKTFMHHLNETKYLVDKLNADVYVFVDNQTICSRGNSFTRSPKIDMFTILSQTLGSRLKQYWDPQADDIYTIMRKHYTTKNLKLVHQHATLLPTYCAKTFRTEYGDTGSCVWWAVDQYVRLKRLYQLFDPYKHLYKYAIRIRLDTAWDFIPPLSSKISPGELIFSYDNVNYIHDTTWYGHTPDVLKLMDKFIDYYFTDVPSDRPVSVESHLPYILKRLSLTLTSQLCIRWKSYITQPKVKECSRYHNVTLYRIESVHNKYCK
jgi:hypothetical protein